MKNLLLVFGIAFLLVSCEKKDLTNETVSNQDLMLKSGVPDQPGDNLKVFRYELGLGWVFYDEDMNLTAYVSFDPRQYCDGLDPAAFEILNIQDIVKDGDDDEPRIHTLINQDDVTVVVWEGPVFPCDDVFLTDPVYTGIGHLVFTDNDAIAFLRENDNNNVYGFRLNGHGIQIKVKGMWDGEDESTIKEDITIRLK